MNVFATRNSCRAGSTGTNRDRLRRFAHGAPGLPIYLLVMEAKTRVLYNETCPVCRFEIDHYRSYARQNVLPIAFDRACADDLTVWGLTEDEAVRRLHVIQNGEILTGVPAFIALWQDMQRYRWLARVVAIPPIRVCASLVYDHLLAPALYAWHRKRQPQRPS